MDIRDIQPGSAPAPDPGRRIQQAPPATVSGAGRQDAGDHVSMSDRAHAFRDVRQAALTVPEVRADRVQEVRARLAAGSWVPDLDRLARLLIARGVLD